MIDSYFININYKEKLSQKLNFYFAQRNIMRSASNNVYTSNQYHTKQLTNIQHIQHLEKPPYQ